MNDKIETRKMVTTSPENSETPLESIQSCITSNSLFFVLSHFETPTIDLSSWMEFAAGGAI